MVFNLNRVHHIFIQYFHCSPSAVPHCVQLLCARWFPAMILRPSTSFSFNLLDFFHKLQDQNKCNSYDFYHTIMQHANNAGLEPEIVGHECFPFHAKLTPTQFRYNEICTVFRIWTHLKLLKWGGAGHQCGGVDSMVDGSLATLCPACPQPGKNTVADPKCPVYA